jgi:hypothetical protein
MIWGRLTGLSCSPGFSQKSHVSVVVEVVMMEILMVQKFQQRTKLEGSLWALFQMFSRYTSRDQLVKRAI